MTFAKVQHSADCLPKALGSASKPKRRRRNSHIRSKERTSPSRKPTGRQLLLTGFGVLAILAVSAVGYYSGHPLDPTAFYLGAVAFVAWRAGVRFGVGLLALSAAALWLFGTDRAAEPTPEWVSYWNWFTRLVILGGALWGLASLRRMRGEAQTDELTGLSNRRAFFLVLEREIERNRRYSAPFTLAYLDCDNFKAFNDRAGHAEGDKLLRLIGETLRSSVRTVDVVARLGGDEFAILFPQTDRQSAEVVLARLREQLDARLSELDGGVTLSVGAMSYEHPPSSADAALRSADALMYRVKRGGKHGLLLEAS